MSCEDTETNGARFDSLNMEKSRNYREQVLRRRELFLKRTKIDFCRCM